MFGIFPFGQPVVAVEQADRDPMPVFVLGVYASAVYARWIGPNGRQRIQALAVASEPEPFWRGGGAASIVARVQAPSAVGHLEAAEARFNGAIGRALDDLILTPLGLRRSLTWLCNLVPHSCASPGQLAAIEREYMPLVATHNLPPANLPPLPVTFSDEHRAHAIGAEIAASTASLLILLGEEPIRHFLYYFDRRHARLSDFGRHPDSYGRLHRASIDGRRIQVLPLAHPRQIARLGQSPSPWYDLHQAWLAVAPQLLLSSR